MKHLSRKTLTLLKKWPSFPKTPSTLPIPYDFRYAGKYHRPAKDGVAGSQSLPQSDFQLPISDCRFEIVNRKS